MYLANVVQAVVLLINVLHVASKQGKEREAEKNAGKCENSVGVVEDIPGEADNEKRLDAK